MNPEDIMPSENQFLFAYGEKLPSTSDRLKGITIDLALPTKWTGLSKFWQDWGWAGVRSSNVNFFSQYHQTIKSILTRLPGDRIRFHRLRVQCYKDSTPHFRHQLQVQVVTYASDWLEVNWRLSWPSSLGLINFVRAAHRTQRNILLTRLPVYYVKCWHKLIHLKM